MTVVVAGASGRTYVGRYHERGARGLVMHDVGIHDPAASGVGIDEWLARQMKFGIRVDHKVLVVPEGEAGEIRRLAEAG